MCPIPCPCTHVQAQNTLATFSFLKRSAKFRTLRLGTGSSLAWNDQLPPRQKHTCSSSKTQLRGHLILEAFPSSLRQSLSYDPHVFLERPALRVTGPCHGILQ